MLIDKHIIPFTANKIYSNILVTYSHRSEDGETTWHPGPHGGCAQEQSENKGMGSRYRIRSFKVIPGSHEMI